jgi:hypothetical protein
MQREMDCLSHQDKPGSNLDWQDVCYTYQAPQENIKSTFKQEQDVVKRELDVFESKSKTNNSFVKEELKMASNQQASVVIQVPSEQEDETPVQKIRSIIKHKEHDIKLGTEISYLTYRETIGVHDRGAMYGLYGAYTYRPKKDDLVGNDIVNMYRIDAKLSYGEIKYSSEDGTFEGIPDYLFEIRGVMGYDYALTSDIEITPYLGIGYRRLFDGFSEVRPGGYDRIANYIYLPVGLDLYHQINSSWSIGGTGEFDIFLWGLQQSYLSQVNPGLPDIENNQHNGFGLRASLPIIHKGNRYNFIIEPFLRYWHIKDSTLDYGVFYEPDNTSTEAGVKLGAQF